MFRITIASPCMSLTNGCETRITMTLPADIRKSNWWSNLAVKLIKRKDSIVPENFIKICPMGQLWNNLQRKIDEVQWLHGNTSLHLRSICSGTRYGPSEAKLTSIVLKKKKKKDGTCMLQHIYNECRVTRFICHTPWTSLTEDTSTENPRSLDWVVKVLSRTYTKKSCWTKLYLWIDRQGIRLKGLCSSRRTPSEDQIRFPQFYSNVVMYLSSR